MNQRSHTLRQKKGEKEPSFSLPRFFVALCSSFCPSDPGKMAIVPNAAASRAAIARAPGGAAPAQAKRAAPVVACRAVIATSSTETSSPSSSRREPPSLQGSDADKLREGIATFYDESSKLWEDVW